MSVGPVKHPVIVALDVLILVFAVSEFLETWFHVELGLLVPETALQIVVMVMRAIGVWHAARHL